MVSIADREFWKDFFQLYHQFPEVWDIKCEKYKNRFLRRKAYSVLLGKYKEIHKNATEDILKKKLNNFRTCYRRELRKVNKSFRLGHVYKPSLWYFEDLNFLRDQESKIKELFTMDLEFDDNNSILEESIASTTSQYKNHQPAVEKVDEKKIERNQVLFKPLQHLDSQAEIKDDTDTLAASWAACFRKLDAKQQLFANKAIHEVLFQGALGRLNEQSLKLISSRLISDSDCSLNNNL